MSHKNNSYVWTPLAAFIGLVLLATTHLVYVTFASRPQCVPHSVVGRGETRRGAYAASKSSCTGPIEDTTNRGGQPS